MGKILIIENTTEIKENEFKDNKEIREIYFISNVEKIGAGAFSGCDNVKTIYLFDDMELSPIKYFDYSGKIKVIYLDSTKREWAQNEILKRIKADEKKKIEEQKKVDKQKKYFNDHVIFAHMGSDGKLNAYKNK